MIVLRSIGMSLLAAVLIGAAAGMTHGVLRESDDFPGFVIALLFGILALPASLLAFPVLYFVFSGLQQQTPTATLKKVITGIAGAIAIFALAFLTFWSTDESVNTPEQKIIGSIIQAALLLPGWLAYWAGMAYIPAAD